MTPLATAEPVVPDSHFDLFVRPIVGILTTLMPDGRPHSCPVWIDFDGTCARTDTSLERQSGRNLLANPSVSLLVVDPDDTSRFVQIRGEAELIREGSLEQLDSLTRKYTAQPSYYGHVFPIDQRERETRVTVRIHARRITVDAIHA